MWRESDVRPSESFDVKRDSGAFLVQQLQKVVRR